MGATPQIENLTETVQFDLGIQQAQTFLPEDIVADAIARLVRRRGDVTRLLGLWGRDTAPSLVADFRREEHEEAIDRLRKALDVNLVIQRRRDGLPKSFRPLVPELVTHEKVSTVFRDLGRTVVDVLWRDEEVRRKIAERVTSWGRHHPLAVAIAPLCEAVAKPDALFASDSRLGELLRNGTDPTLEAWVNKVVTPDWRGWLVATERMGVDEQLDMMVALACLHLHVAVLWRLWNTGQRPIVFIAVSGQNMDRMCARAAYNMYVYWGERAHEALKRAAINALQKARAACPGFSRLETVKDLSAWGIATIEKGRSANQRFKSLVDEAAHTPGVNPEQALQDALVGAFETPSGVAKKVKDFLRGTGRAAGLVGPDEFRARKRYQMDDRLLELLVRLHLSREGGPSSAEDDAQSVHAFLDDIFERYGIVVTRERHVIRESLAQDDPQRRTIIRLLPGDEAMRRNRQVLEQRLDELRLIRRYSDDSAVLHVD